jgi:hypothetical protein
MRVMLASQHINAYGDNFLVINRINPAIVGFTEMDAGKVATGLRQAKRQMPKYDFFSNNIGPHSQEVPVAIRRTLGNNPYDHQTTLLHAKVNPGTGNDRYMTAVEMTRFGKKLVVIQTHWMAALQHRDTGLVYPKGNQRAAAMEVAFDLMQKAITGYLNSGYEAIVMGDFNYKILSEWMKKDTWQLWDHSPQALFKSLHMDWHESRLDYMAISDGLYFKGGIKEFPAGGFIKGAGRNYSDHDWLLADIRWKGHK